MAIILHRRFNPNQFWNHVTWDGRIALGYWCKRGKVYVFECGTCGAAEEFEYQSDMRSEIHRHTDLEGWALSD